ncbi:MAG: hypothetical protein ABI867_36080 [Kofleriaceae bacterium]
MWRAILLLAALAACGDNKTQPARDDAGVADAAPPIDTPPPTTVGPCLDRPGDLPTPSAGLPCELLPPGFAQP